MKKTLLFIFLLLPFLVYAQENFQLKGEISNIKESKSIYLIHVADNREIIDSTVLKDGKFEFNIKVKHPTISVLLLNHSGNALKDRGPKDLYRLFIEPGNAVLKAQDSIAKAKLSGLKIFDVYEAFKASTKEIENQLVQLNQEFVGLSDAKKAKED